MIRLLIEVLGFMSFALLLYTGYRDNNANQFEIKRQAELIAQLLQERYELELIIDQLEHELKEYGVRD